MMTPEMISRGLDRILPFVQKPARYTGGEYNAVVKDWAGASYRLALIFPDVYDLGMSNLGLAILYDRVNQKPDMLAERAYTPWVDMASALKRDRSAAVFTGGHATHWGNLMFLVSRCHTSNCTPMC